MKDLCDLSLCSPLYNSNTHTRSSCRICICIWNFCFKFSFVICICIYICIALKWLSERLDKKCSGGKTSSCFGSSCYLALWLEFKLCMVLDLYLYLQLCLYLYFFIISICIFTLAPDATLHFGSSLNFVWC